VFNDYGNFLCCAAAIGIVVEILFCGFDNVRLIGKTWSTKKIATDSPTRAAGESRRGDCPNDSTKKPHLLRQGL